YRGISPRDEDAGRREDTGRRGRGGARDGKKKGPGGRSARSDTPGRGGKSGRFDARRRGRDDRPAGRLRDVPGGFKLKARIDKNRKGFGFLQFENKEYEDAFLNPQEAEKFFHGDRVEATI